MKINSDRYLPKLFDERDGSLSRDWCGYVDSWGSDTGITGWVFKTRNNKDKKRKIVVELEINGTVVASTPVNKVRSDISTIVGGDWFTGFSFDQGAYKEIAKYILSNSDGLIKVRVAGTKTRLLSKDELQLASSIVANWRNSLLPSPYFGENATNFKVDFFLQGIARRRQGAEWSLSKPLLPIKNNEIGFIESICFDSCSLIWVIGWITKGVSTSYGAILLDQNKYISALEMIFINRADLQSDQQGFIGLLDSDWRPNATTTEFVLYLCSDDIYFLRGSTAITYVSKTDVLTYFDQMYSEFLSGDIECFSSVLNSVSSWELSGSSSVIQSPSVSIDNLFLLEGFGCIIEGWVVSLIKTPKTYEIKIGDTILYAEDSTTYYKLRNDLADVFPYSERAIRSAGVVAVLLGSIASANHQEYKLKIVYMDGSFSVHAIDKKIVRVLDPHLDSEQVLRILPAIQFESWFPLFCRVIHTRTRMASLPPVQFKKDQCFSKVIIIYWPEDLDTQYLIMDDIHTNLNLLKNNSISLCLISHRCEGIGNLKKFLNDLQVNFSDLSVSAFLIYRENLRMEFLPRILVELAVESFAFFGPGISVSKNGWAVACDSLVSNTESPTLLELGYGVESRYTPDAMVTTDAWAWKTSEFLEFLLKNPPSVRGEFTNVELLNILNPIKILESAIRVITLNNSVLPDIIDRYTIQNILDARK